MTEYYFVLNSLKDPNKVIYLKTSRPKIDLLPMMPMYRASYVFSLQDGKPVFVKNRNYSSNPFTDEELVIIRLTAEEYQGPMDGYR